MTAPLLLHVFSTFAVGGPQMRFAAIANHCGAGLRHAVVAMDGDLTAAARLQPGLAIAFPAVAVCKGDTPGNLRRFAATLRRLRPDTLVTYNWGSIEWAMANALVRCRHIHIEDGFGPEERSRQLPRRVLTRRLLLRRAHVVLPSRTLLAIATEIWRLPRLRYIPNGIDLARFTPGPPPEPRAPAVIGTVAALRAEKNLARLLDAVALLPQGRLVIVGDGPQRGALTAHAAALGIADRVHFAGAMADPAAAYRQFDVFALSSDTEQMPLSVLEAMASGLAVAATDVGDVGRMLDAANRPYVVAQDAAALAGALGALLADAGRRAAIGAANRARAEAEFGAAAMVAAYAALFACAPA